MTAGEREVEGGLIARRAARVILLDPAGRVLMLRGCDPARPTHRYWLTVGGGLEPGESLAAGAIREVFEETGLRLDADQLTGPVRRETAEFPFDGRWYSQDQDFFVARVAADFEVDLSRLDDDERRTVDEARWWSVDELAGTADRFYPEDFVGLLREVI